MKFNNNTITSSVITICLLLLIALLVKLCENEWQRGKHEGLQYYGHETKSLDAPLAYKSVMENIKYPVTNPETKEPPIYDIGNKVHNNLLFNKKDKNMHFSDEQIKKDLKYFNNASNILLEHYLNNNVPNSVIVNVQDISDGQIPSSRVITETDISDSEYYSNIDFKVFNETIASPTYPTYLSARNENSITNTKTYLYRLSNDYDPNGTDPPSNGIYKFKDTTILNNQLEEDNIYNYKYDLSGIDYTQVYDELTKYNDSSFNSVVSMINPGKYSSHYFESNYSDLSDNITKDFKYFYSAAPTIAGYGLFIHR